MKKSQLIQLVKEELRGWSPQVGQTKGLTPKTLNKILMKIASDDEYEPEGEVEERLKEALTQLKEEKPGLWANIRAKRARGEKPAHKNSNAHKDAVAAGKKINAMKEGKSLQDLQMGEKFTFNGKMYTFIELYPELEDAAKVIRPNGEKSVMSFGGGRVNTGKKAGIGPDAFGQGKGHHID